MFNFIKLHIYHTILDPGKTAFTSIPTADQDNPECISGCADSPWIAAGMKERRYFVNALVSQPEPIRIPPRKACNQVRQKHRPNAEDHVMKPLVGVWVVVGA
jgi:hypothetical protein